MAVNATAIWRVRPSGSNTNGGGYDPGIGGAATDYSQQNAAQASGSNATCATGTSTFIDATANAFTSAMIGNAIWIASGTNFTVGAYFVTAFTSASTVTLDRSPVGGTNGSVGVWALGGGWADPFTNFTTSGPVVAGNIAYILGSGTPNPASYVYDYTATTFFTPQSGNTTAGYINWANDPNTPGYKAPPDTTGGMPTIKTAGLWVNGSSTTYIGFSGIWFVASATTFTNLMGHITGLKLVGCVYDQFGFDVGLTINDVADTAFIGCEVFSSSGGSGGSAYAIDSSFGVCDGCNIHDTVGNGLRSADVQTMMNCIVAKCSGVGITFFGRGFVINCTVDGNTGHGIELLNTNSMYGGAILNNIISNHTTAAKVGLKADSAVPALMLYADYNVYYNNTSNYSGVNAGPHDTALGVTPYVGSGTENYTLA